MISLFQKLRISPTYSKDLIKKAFTKIIKIVHPDLGGNQDEFIEVLESYNILMAQRWVLATKIKIDAKYFLTGCTPRVMIQPIDGKDTFFVKFTIPPLTYPGTIIEFSDEGQHFRITLLSKQQGLEDES